MPAKRHRSLVHATKRILEITRRIDRKAKHKQPANLLARTEIGVNYMIRKRNAGILTDVIREFNLSHLQGQNNPRRGRAHKLLQRFQILLKQNFDKPSPESRQVVRELTQTIGNDRAAAELAARLFKVVPATDQAMRETESEIGSKANSREFRRKFAENFKKRLMPE